MSQKWIYDDAIGERNSPSNEELFEMDMVRRKGAKDLPPWVAVGVYGLVWSLIFRLPSANFRFIQDSRPFVSS